MKFTPLLSALVATAHAKFLSDADIDHAFDDNNNHARFTSNAEIDHHFDDRYKKQSSHEALLRNLANAMPRESNVPKDYKASKYNKLRENKHEKVLRLDAAVKQNYLESTVPSTFKSLKNK